jgi:hypothetical protein
MKSRAGVMPNYVRCDYNRFKNAAEAGDWHIKSVEKGLHFYNAHRKRAGRPRMSKAEFRKRLMEDLKHDI